MSKSVRDRKECWRAGDQDGYKLLEYWCGMTWMAKQTRHVFSELENIQQVKDNNSLPRTNNFESDWGQWMRNQFDIYFAPTIYINRLQSTLKEFNTYLENVPRTYNQLTTPGWVGIHTSIPLVKVEGKGTTWLKLDLSYRLEPKYPSFTLFLFHLIDQSDIWSMFI